MRKELRDTPPTGHIDVSPPSLPRRKTCTGLGTPRHGWGAGCSPGRECYSPSANYSTSRSLSCIRNDGCMYASTRSRNSF